MVEIRAKVKAMCVRSMNILSMEVLETQYQKIASLIVLVSQSYLQNQSIHAVPLLHPNANKSLCESSGQMR
jgi:hypothetical protein